VIAHVRGSSFLGNKWHHDGRRLKRKNRAFDFIAVTDFLIKNNYTNKDKIIASGGSAGGELMLVVSNMRPDLFKVVIADVPGGDLLNKMLDPTLGGVIFHYEEIGNPEIKENYEYIKSYCPYENIESKTYPNMFLRTSLFDSRTFYWETAKFTAKMREYKKGSNINIMKTAMIGGHSGNGDWYKNRAEEYAFAFKFLNINE
jgi:oligopeptidase B